MSQSANDLLMGGGLRAVKWEHIGQVVIGTIVDEPKVEQLKKHESTELDFWPSGDPKMQIIVTIQTDYRDPGNAEDDGKRRLHIPPRMMTPLRESVRKTGAKGIAMGGRIAVQWASGSGVGAGNAREYATDYAPPAIDPGSLLAAAPVAAAPPQAAPVAAVPVAATPVVHAAPAPVAAPVAATAPGGLLAAVPVNTALMAPPQGVDPAVWANLPEAQRQAVLAAMASPAAQVAPF